MPHGFQYQALAEPVIQVPTVDRWECRQPSYIKRAGLSLVAMALTASTFVTAGVPGPAKWEEPQPSPPAVKRVLQPHYGDVIRVSASVVTPDMWITADVLPPRIVRIAPPAGIDLVSVVTGTTLTAPPCVTLTQRALTATLTERAMTATLTQRSMTVTLTQRDC